VARSSAATRTKDAIPPYSKRATHWRGTTLKAWLGLLGDVPADRSRKKMLRVREDRDQGGAGDPVAAEVDAQRLVFRSRPRSR